MAYYAAIVSLRKTIQHLLDSSQFSILPCSRKILESAYEEVRSLHKVLQENDTIISNSNNERLKSLNEKIREAACKLEDALETHLSNHFQRLAFVGSSLTVSLDLKEVKKQINSSVEMMKKIKKMMTDELSKPLPEEDDVVPSIIDFAGKNSKMVGLSEEFEKLKDLLLLPGHDAVSMVGMAGIGKTALAMKIFEDLSISSYFDPRVFVTMGPKFRFRKVMLSILAQMKHDIDEICMEKDENLVEYICRSLRGRRYLIVLDDVWDTKDDVWDIKAIFKLQRLRPNEINRSRVLVTTRLQSVAEVAAHRDHIHYMRFLNKEESWDLLCEKLFGEGNLCPLQLEKPGKKIAENCEGLPLTIVTVANILSKEEKTLDYWKKVAKKENSVFTDAYDQMWKVLILSYNYLPQLLKPLFLYMGVFPVSCKIPTSNLFKLWHVERFLDQYPRFIEYLSPDSLEGFENLAKTCLIRLVSASIVLVDEKSSSDRDHIKTCSLHSVYWHLCVKEAGKENFFHVMNRYASSFTEGIENQRRLCIHNNILFAITDVYNSIESIPMVHSLLCTGPYHQYPVPICFGFRLLMVLDALTIRFYKFPIEVLKLVLLRYLALTFSGKVPGSISKLWNLEHLIIHRHLSINEPSLDLMHLPIEIWNMKKLRHIQVTGGNLPDPCGAILPNLLILSDMSVNCCSKEILERTPNLEKLGIQIELTPNAIEPLSCFDHFSHLDHLKSFKCAIVNPKPRSYSVACISTFPFHLKKLSLSGLGYPWEYMKIIAELPQLEVLKLRCYAFQGPVWETYDGESLVLRYLLLEDTDLVHWRSHGGSKCFPFLQDLIISHCYKLKEIPSSLGRRPRERKLKLADCTSFMTSVEQLQWNYPFSDISFQSSMDDEK